jgi:hypothetical protein
MRAAWKVEAKAAWRASAIWPSGWNEGILRPLHEVDRSRPHAANHAHNQGAESNKLELGAAGRAEDQDSRSRGTGRRLLHDQCCLDAETVADRLGQSRTVHLPFYAGDNLSIMLDPAFLFHEAALL